MFKKIQPLYLHGKSAFLAVVFSISFYAEANTNEFLRVPYDGKVTNLRVLVLNNGRIAPLDASITNNLLAKAKSLAKTHLNLQIEFSEPDYADLKKIKSMLQPEDINWIKDQSLNLQLPEDLKKLELALIKDLDLSNRINTEIYTYARPYLLKQPADSSEQEFAAALSSTQSLIQKTWKARLLRDSSPLITSDLMNEFAFWDYLGYLPIPYEVVLTNQPIISSEKVGNSVHSALRGGVSNGITNSSLLSKNGAYSVVSIFPFFDKDRVTKALRNNLSYSKEDATTYAAAMLVHELGHQLLHLGHPFSNSACVMRPPLRLQFDTWFKALDPVKCKIGSSEAMMPGVSVKFSDIRPK